ncbi:MAG: Asp-tRNA(Asn)/Glu-tRNA(Gln) amidotransferase subunit GatC [Chthoniobacterales bacterium]
MSNTNLDVRYVANLARMELTEEEITTFQDQLERVLNHVEKLNQVDVTNVEPTAHARPVFNVFRKDTPRPGLEKSAALSNAPRQSNGLFSVPKVVE